ncbi:MAG: hypothetical protein HDS41_00380 [Bacteroides sp.]|nr:hypothetical protein [Bacteroides sp.]
MIRIERHDIRTIAEEYFNLLNDWRKRLTKRSSLYALASVYPQKLRELILCEPGGLEKCRNHTGVAGTIFPDAYNAFFYNYYVDDAKTVNVAQWLSKRLKIRVCPYCNRTYTFTVEKEHTHSGRVVRIKPEMDHFFPKSNAKYQHLALSFYNLIPSCPICNHVKGKEQIDYHPYAGHLAKGGEPYFEVQMNNPNDNGIFPDNPIVTIQNSNKNVDILALKELYLGHSDYVKELLDKIQAYNHSLYEPLINSFQMAGKTSEYVDKLIWGTSVDVTELDKRPLSKLTHDILRQFNVLD